MNGMLRGACKCGWARELRVKGYPSLDAARMALEKAFVEHIPFADRSAGIYVNVFPCQEMVAVMPEGEPAQLEAHWEDGDVRYGRLIDGRILPIIEIRTQDGRVFKMDDE